MILGAVLVVAVRWVLDVDPVQDPGADPSAPVESRVPESRVPEIILAPGTDLFDMAESEVTVMGFTPGSRIAAVLCGRQAHLTLADSEPLPSRCDTGTLIFADTDEDGNADMALTFPRRLRIGGDVVDCGAEACLLRVVNLDEPGEDVTIPLTFDAATASSGPPTLAVDSTQVSHATTVTVTGTGIRGLRQALIVQCAMSAPTTWTYCHNPTFTDVVSVDPGGRLEAEFEISRYIGTSRGWHDCSDIDPGACVLLIRGEAFDGERVRLPTAVPLEFDPGEPPPEIEALVSPDVDLTDGQSLTMTFDTMHIRTANIGTALGTTPVVAICRADDSACADLKSRFFSFGLTVWLVTPMPRRFTARTDATLEIVDCLETPCVARLVPSPGDDRHADFPIFFDPDATLRPPITLTTTTPGPLPSPANIDIGFIGRPRREPPRREPSSPKPPRREPPQ